MIKRLKAMIKELFIPTRLETDTASNKSYRRAVVAIAHCVLGAGVMYALVLISIPVVLAGFTIMWFYTIKEAIDYFESKDGLDCVVDWLVTATGVLLFASPFLSIIALGIGAVIFFAYI